MANLTDVSAFHHLMATPVEAILLLCDSAVVDPAGKVHMLGAGWSTVTSPTPPTAVAVFLKIPWDRTNQKIPVKLTLVDQDGQPVSLPGQERVGVDAHVEAGRPPGIAEGSMIDSNFQVSFGPMPLPAGRYSWRLEIASGEVFAQHFQVIGRS